LDEQSFTQDKSRSYGHGEGAADGNRFGGADVAFVFDDAAVVDLDDALAGEATG
jgi:hypothetical protein